MSEEKALGCLVVGVILLIATAVGWSVFKNYIWGNRQMIDTKTRFNTAYILEDDAKFGKYRIRAWNDYENSDSVQVVLEDGRAIYTHLRNVKLTNE